MANFFFEAKKKKKKTIWSSYILCTVRASEARSVE